MTTTQITPEEVAGSGFSFEHARRALDKINAAIARLDLLSPSEGASVLGDGTGSPSLTFDKLTAGTSDVSFKTESVERWAIRADASQNLSIRRYDGTGTFVDAVSFNVSTGAVSLPGALAVTGHYTSTAGNITLTNGALALTNGNATIGGTLGVTGDYTSAAGNLTLTAGTATAARVDITGAIFNAASLPVHADNAAASGAGLGVGRIYATITGEVRRVVP